ncbi:hypothetical protein [Pseudomonas sp. NPDC007930]|uniref:hypothetical protein n=1 Tax=Pseudomonas sp. NPDC007930 TaxID=3364417 RepID=UPI0036EAF5AD
MEIRKNWCCVLLMIAAATTGCSTKNYGRQPDLTTFEASTMTCREIDLEQAKVEGFINHVNDESRFDGRSVLSFMGDFGIGNVMEKSSALDSANQRLSRLKSVRAVKACALAGDTARPPVARVDASPAPAADPLATQARIDALQQDKSLSYEEYQRRYKQIIYGN